MDRLLSYVVRQGLVALFALVVLCAPALVRAAEGGAQSGGDAPSVCPGDVDCDGILDGEEGDLDGDEKLGPSECDPKMADTDGDGVPDGIERKMGTGCNLCDSDGDGLSDGVELGYIQPDDANGCHGLQPAGTNYKRPHVMDPLNPDSDGDGLKDGGEDENNNGWVDADETDPSITDTDGDNLSDDVEATGDFDGDGLADFDFRLIKAGPKCSPPQSIADVDCDGIPNARSVDSDSDGCSDTEEGGWIDSNNNGIPDVYDNQTKLCLEGVSTPGSGGGSSGSAGQEEENGKPEIAMEYAGDPNEGGTCSLINNIGISATLTKKLHVTLFIFFSVIFILSAARQKKYLS